MKIGDLLDGEYLFDEIVIISHVLKRDKSWVLAHLDDEIPGDVFLKIKSLIDKRKGGYPLHYITGVREFMGLEFEVEEGVFIPRPETERLVELALDYIRKYDVKVVADVGTGSGAIAVSLAKIAGVGVLASDVSPKAVEVARKNVKKHGVEKLVRVRLGAFLEPFEGERIDLVVSNPPYVESTYDLPPEVRHEPPEAIFSGEDGLDFLREYFERYGRKYTTLMEFSGSDEAVAFLKRICPDVSIYEGSSQRPKFFLCQSSIRIPKASE